MKLDLLPTERAALRAQKIRISEIAGLTVTELSKRIHIMPVRAMEIHALAEFQSIPSIGIQFTRDIVSLGYYSLEEIKDKDGVALIEELELSCGCWADPCLEDQCRLVVHYARYRDDSKRWWDFTAERKKYRAENGYPSNRPTKAWYEVR